MSKIITSPFARWPGTVTLCDDPGWDLIDALEASFGTPQFEGERVYFSVIDRTKIPAILAWVEAWQLDNFPQPVTLENFPKVPRRDSHELIEWLDGEIRQLYLGAGEVPNG